MSRASSLWEWLLLLICHRLTGIWEGTFAPHAAVQSQGCRSSLAFAFNSVNTCWLFSVKKNCQRAYWKSTVKGYFRFDIYQKKGWWRHWRQMAIWVIRTIKKNDGIWYSKEREKEKDGMKVMEFRNLARVSWERQQWGSLEGTMKRQSGVTVWNNTGGLQASALWEIKSILQNQK